MGLAGGMGQAEVIGFPNHFSRRRFSRSIVAAACLFAALTCRAEDFLYVVQPGDNPWNLTDRYLKGIAYWPKLQSFNHIVDPNHLKPGTVLRIPFEWLQLSAAEVRLVALHGDVTWSTRDAASFDPAPLGAKIEPGARLRTGSNASATLQFSDGSRVLLLPGTELSIARAGRFAAGAGTMVRLELIRGSIENLVHPNDGPRGRFEIQTPAAVAAVRGTEFRVSATRGEARTEVLGGVVDLGNEAGRQALKSGFGTLAEAGKAPRAPTPLLPPPDLSGVPRLVERLPLDAPIPAIPGAIAY